MAWIGMNRNGMDKLRFMLIMEWTETDLDSLGNNGSSFILIHPFAGETMTIPPCNLEKNNGREGINPYTFEKSNVLPKWGEVYKKTNMFRFPRKDFLMHIFFAMRIY